MEEIVTLDGRQFKLTVDRPLNATERAQVLTEIRKQTGCGTCNQPRTMSAGSGFGDIYSLTDTCTGATKASGQTVSLVAGPNGAIGPYYVRFWRYPNITGTMAWGELGSYQTCAEGNTVGTSFTLYDTDFVFAQGDTTAKVAVTDSAGTISAGTTVSTLAPSKIRVATTVFDSCPVTPQSCVSVCDVNLACVAPTCNFVVS